MSTIKISAMAQKTTPAGTERIPVSDSGVAKSVTVDVVKQYIIDAIEAITAGTAVTGADSVFILQSGALKPVDIDVVAQHAIDTIWGKADYTPASGSDKIVIKTGATEKTATITNLAEYIRSLIESTILDVSDLSTSGALTSGDYYLVVQGSTPKKTTLSAISTAVFTALNAYVTALSAVTAPGDTDVFHVIQGGVEKKVTLATLKGVVGDVFAPATTTENKIPQWSSAADTLKDGLTVQATLRASGTAADTALPTEKAVRDAISMSIFEKTDIGADLADEDTLLVDDGGAGALRKSVMSRMWTYVWSKVSGATSKATPIGADSIGVVDSAASSVVKNVTLTNLWNNLLLALAKAIKLDDFTAPDDNTDLDATTSVHGLAPKAVAPSPGLMNVLGVENGGTAYANKALFDATVPVAVGTGAAGSAMTAARRDHVHNALPYVAVDGTLATGANDDFAPTKLVYNKTCSDSDGNDVIDLHDGTIIGQVLTIYLGTKSGSDNAVITPVTKLGYSTVTLDTANETATFQWQGATVGWVILGTTGTIA